MKKLFTVLFMIFFAGSFIYAQGKMGIGIQGGVAIPTGDFGDAAGTGFGGSGTFMYNVNPMFSVTGSIGYFTWGPKEDLPQGYDYSLSTIPVLLGVRYNFGKGNFLPYVLGEAGLHFLSSTVENLLFGKLDESETKFGVAPGAGFYFLFNPKTMLDVNVIYNVIFTEGESTSYIGINAGVAFLLQ